MPQVDHTSQIIDSFFRHEYGRLVAHLLSKYGTTQFDAIEDSVQEALLKAAKVWPFKGVPDNPTGWLVRVATNSLLDVLRRHKTHATKRESIIAQTALADEPDDIVLQDQLNDDLLNMMFACCHPSISAESQVILTLKILCGFGNAEIARALLKSQEAVAKAFTRAKAKMRVNKVKPEVPLGAECNDRLNIILKIIYLVFNEGYCSTIGDAILKQDLCYESMRLTKLLIDHPLLNQPQVNATMALMCFQASRFNARVDSEGSLLTLEHQDRSKWDKELIKQGACYLYKSDRFGALSSYHIEARIAACHAMAPSYKDTDWHQMLALYNHLVKINSNAFTKLNRLVAFGQVHGAKEALKKMQQLRPILINHYLYHAVEASFYEAIGNNRQAIKSYKKALMLTQNEVEKNHLTSRVRFISLL